jgi:hypothetical protein
MMMARNSQRVPGHRSRVPHPFALWRGSLAVICGDSSPGGE